MKHNAVKLNELQLKKIVAESVKKGLKESDVNNTDFDMFPEDGSMRNRDGLNNTQRKLRHIHYTQGFHSIEIGYLCLLLADSCLGIVLTE